MKKTAILCLILAVVLLAGCGGKEETQPTEATIELPPGLSDSIFDNDSVELDISTKPTTATTIPEGTQDTTPVDTKPTQKPEIPTAPQNPGNMQEPELPTEQEPEKPNQDVTGDQGPIQCSYEEFAAMTPAQQQACMESYESIEAFFAWYNQAKQEYDAAHPPIDVGNGSIDLDKVLGGKK